MTDQQTKNEVLAILKAPLRQKLYYRAIALTGNPAEAENLVQEVCYKAWRFRHQFEPGTNFEAWLFQILKNTFINWLRKKKSEPQTQDIQSIGSWFADEEDSFGGEWRLALHEATLACAKHKGQDTKQKQTALRNLFRRIFVEPVFDALDALPSTFLMTVILADLFNYKYAEIAEVLGCPIGTVMSRLFRSREHLARELKGYAQEYRFIH